jgi:hypothetical protein
MAHYIKKRNVEMTESSLEIMETRRKRMRSLKNWSEERGRNEQRRCLPRIICPVKVRVRTK